MGAVRIAFEKDSKIEASLKEAGFEYEEYVFGTDMGFQKRFYSDDGLYCTYVHCDLENNRLQAYKEYDCGGYISSMESDIPEHIIENDDPDVFVDWLDEETEYFINS